MIHESTTELTGLLFFEPRDLSILEPLLGGVGNCPINWIYWTSPTIVAMALH